MKKLAQGRGRGQTVGPTELSGGVVRLQDLHDVNYVM